MKADLWFLIQIYLLKEKESAWVNIVYTFFPEVMQCIQNKE